MFEALSRFTPGQMIGLGVTMIGLLGFFAYLALRIVEPDFGLLYSGLDLEDSAEIVGRLEALGVPYELHGGGEGIMVPANRVARLRMAMAEEGLPRGGSVGDEIFDQAGALGTTTFLASINQRRALEGELSRTIAALKDVKAARVHLVLPKRELFRREQIEPSASVTLRMFGGRRLDKRQAAAVQHLVAAAVPGLQPDRITLVDDRGTLLVKGGEAAFEGGLASQADDYRIAYETRLKNVIEQLLERSLGPGRVHAEVSAEIDFDQVTTMEENFDPEGQVVRSTQSIEEETERAERTEDGAVTVGNNLPNTGAEGGGAGNSNNESSVRTEETVNYEISRTVRNHTQVGGQVKRLSVAVLVGGRESLGVDGEPPVFAPLDQQELDEIASLVRSAIGFDADRGDTVEVTNMPFAESVLEEIETSLFDLTKSDILRLAELGGLLLLALMAIFLVVRPALAKLSPEPVTLDERVTNGGLPVMIDENGQVVSVATGTAGGQGADADGSSSSPSGAGVEGDADASGLGWMNEPSKQALIQQTRDVIEARPDDAAAIVKQWIAQEPEGSDD
ncbi:MAG: flagellar basal-body MS-ring/collar protein FliF [Alphaproteobacteria bacterium]|nr:flagellar basal-body MS-ring/collar protein FliF [Alphaproteobacteria bacterium]